MNTKTLLSPLALAVSLAFPGAAHAEESYPTRAVTIVVPFAAGGPVDFVAREVGNLLSQETGQTFVVQNIGGGQGIPAMNRVGRAPADGYTLLLAGASNVTDQPLATDASREAASMLEPVSLVATSPQVLVVSSTLPVKTTQEFIDYAKKNPGVVNFGSAGIGTISHLALELFASRAGVDVVHVPYKGTSLVTQDLRSGAVHALLTSMPSIKPLIDADAIRAIGLTTASVGKDTEGIPQVSETVKGMEYATWYGMYVTKGTPAPVVQKINGDLRKVLSNEELKQKMMETGTQLTASSPAELQERVVRDSKLWTEAVAASKLKSQPKS